VNSINTRQTQIDQLTNIYTVHLGIKNKFNNILDTLGFKQKPRSFQVQYKINLTNRSNQLQTFSVVAPIPPDTTNQKITNQINFEPKLSEIITEKIYQNRIAIWNVTLEPQRSTYLTESFNIFISPITNQLNQNYLLNNYHSVELYPANRFLPYDHQGIVELAQNIKGDEKDIIKIIKKFNQYVVKKLEYGNPIQGLYTADEAISNDQVDCGGFSTLLASLAQAVGIPTRLVVGFWSGYQKNDMHAWLEFKLPNNEWLVADPSIENLQANHRTTKVGKLGSTENDRIIFSYGCDLEIPINNQSTNLDILQHPIVFPLNKNISVELELVTKKL